MQFPHFNLLRGIADQVIFYYLVLVWNRPSNIARATSIRSFCEKDQINAQTLKRLIELCSRGD